MLPARHRMRRSPDFQQTVRRGRRAGGPLVVVHLLPAAADSGPVERSAPTVAAEPAVTTAGLVVSKAVGGAVARTRVKRRLRHLLAARVATLPPGALLVVRANPPAAAATSAELAVDLDRALGSAQRARRPSRTPAPTSRA